VARLIAAAVPLFVATTAVSARLKHKAAMDVGRVLAPLAGFGIGLGLARLTGDPAEYAAAIALALAAAFLLATEGGLAPIAFTVGLAIGLLDPPPVAAVIMIAVVTAVGSWFGALLKGNLGRRPRQQLERLAGLAFAALAIYLFFATAAGSARVATPNLAAYRGLGTWVDIYDAASWAHPETVVAKMKARGVRTLFLETGNYRQTVDIVRMSGQARFIDAAHARGMKVVAWYLPSFAAPKKDLRRSLAAINFRTPSGGQFDSFALDIEASVVKNVGLRNTRLLTLSSLIRDNVGPSYTLGAIIPSPRGMQLLPTYWPGFPYADLGLTYDVFLPMGYFSYRPTDLGGAYGYTVRNIALIRRGTGDPQVAIHAIGGVGDDVSTSQVNAFVKATRDCGIPGASLYDFTTTASGGWKYLRGVRTRAGTSKSSCS
jgi:putative Mn2+ efflux pump MntP